MNIYTSLTPARDLVTAYDAYTGILTLTLSKPVAARLAENLRPIHYPTDGDDQTYVNGLRSLFHRRLPPDLVGALSEVAAGIIEPTAVVFRGLPYDDVEAAPAPGEAPRNCKPSDLSEHLTVGLASLVGEPYGVLGEGSRLANDLIPTSEDRYRLTGNGSGLKLGYHTENAAHRWLFFDRDLSPRGLLLNGVVAAAGKSPRTWIANGRMAAQILRRSAPEHYARLRDDAVELALPLRQRKAGEISRTAPRPVLTGPVGHETVTLALYGDMTRALTDAAAALDAYAAALEQVATSIVIEPGCAVYIPNAYTLHARDAFNPSFDAAGRADRWLQRVFVTGRLDGFHNQASGRGRVFSLPT